MKILPHILATLPILTLIACAEDVSDLPEVDTLNCTLATYRIVTAEVPLSASMARDSASDLNADERPDNAGGGLLSSLLLQQYPSAAGLPALVNERLDSQEVPWFIALDQCPDGRYLFWMLRGEDIDGDGVYELSSRDAPPAQGTMVASSIQVASGGFGEIPIGIFADPLGEAREVWSSGAGVAAAFTREDGNLIGKLGIGLADNYAEIVGRPLAAFLTSRLQAGSSEFAERLDTSGDGVVSLPELEASSLIQATLLNPDLDILRGDVFAPRGDGTEDSLSFGFFFRAVPVEVRWQ